MDKRVKAVFIAVIAVIIAALAFGIGYAIWEQCSEIDVKYDTPAELIAGEGLANEGEITPDEYYVCVTSHMGGTNIYLQFKDGAYTYYLGATPSAFGTYTLENNIAEISYSINGETTVSTNQMIFDGDYTFFDSSICVGDVIPDTDTFNATVSRLGSDGTAYEYTFHEDGTYELLFGKKRGRTNWNTAHGTYERNADGTISRTIISAANGEVMDSLNFYVYNGYLVDSVYTAISAEEFEAQIAELEAERQAQ